MVVFLGKYGSSVGPCLLRVMKVMMRNTLSRVTVVMNVRKQKKLLAKDGEMEQEPQYNSSPSSPLALRRSFLSRASVLEAVIYTRLSALTAQLRAFQHHDVSVLEKCFWVLLVFRHVWTGVLKFLGFFFNEAWETFLNIWYLDVSFQILKL